ncbi:zinc finger protein [Stylonychia lemnae]|uniref:RING-type E3 ubiquitin transferase n=1 Tax=Stylonychia lemnae TaxID=5949 RepID=A0A078B989_STYLE|nr:zinc finger protein [Stylonychia lemnae]|eukprot:CDW91085.1 zinc finger protein [Stylonychia lemnae]
MLFSARIDTSKCGRQLLIWLMIDCGNGDNTEINRLNTFVLIVLILGYIQMLYFLVISIFLIYLLIITGKQSRSQVRNQNEIIDQLPQTPVQTIPPQINLNLDPSDVNNPYGIRDRVQMSLLKRNIEKYIKKLRKIKYKKDMDNPDQLDECAICLTKFIDNDDLLQLQCDKRHLFHRDCGSEWIKINATCPLCRQDFKTAICGLGLSGSQFSSRIIENNSISVRSSYREHQLGTPQNRYGLVRRPRIISVISMLDQDPEQIQRQFTDPQAANQMIILEHDLQNHSPPSIQDQRRRAYHTRRSGNNSLRASPSMQNQNGRAILQVISQYDIDQSMLPTIQNDQGPNSHLNNFLIEQENSIYRRQRSNNMNEIDNIIQEELNSMSDQLAAAANAAGSNGQNRSLQPDMSRQDGPTQVTMNENLATSRTTSRHHRRFQTLRETLFLNPLQI